MASEPSPTPQQHVSGRTATASSASEGEVWLKSDWKDVRWKYPEYEEWKRRWGFNASQFWATTSPESHPLSTPYGFEIQTRRSYPLEWYRKEIAHHAHDQKWTWVQFETEVETTDKSTDVLELVRQARPDVEIWRGHFGRSWFGWDAPTDRDSYEPYDVLVAFYNVGYPDRMGEDMAWVLAQGLWTKKPLFLMVQPVLGGSHELTDPEEYRRGLEIASYAQRGIGMWSADDVYEKPDSEAKLAILEAWAAAKRKPIPQRTVKLPQGLNWQQGRALARIVWHAGYVSEVGTESAKPDVTWENIERLAADADKPRDQRYGWNLTLFYDRGHSRRKVNQKRVVYDLEQRIADDLRDLLIRRSLEPSRQASSRGSQ